MLTRLYKGCSRVAFDSNMLLAIHGMKADVFGMVKELFGSKVSLAVAGQVMQELKRIEKRGRRMEKAVAIAKAEMGRRRVKKVWVKAANADAALLKMAKGGYCIATNDKALRKRIKGFGGTVIYLRQRKFLVAD